MIKENAVRKLARIISMQEEIIFQLKMYCSKLVTKYKVKKRKPTPEQTIAVESEFSEIIDDNQNDIFK